MPHCLITKWNNQNSNIVKMIIESGFPTSNPKVPICIEGVFVKVVLAGVSVAILAVIRSLGP